jgi:phospholipase C
MSIDSVLAVSPAMDPMADLANRLFSRRRFLELAAAIGAASAVDLMTPGLAKAAALPVVAPASLNDIEHFVILMQENRSFDEYFGTMSTVIGFDDPNAIPGVFKQQDLLPKNHSDPYVLPWRFNTAKTCAQALPNLDHEWVIQHLMWNEGQMNQFLLGQGFNPQVMGYFTQHDVPYHWALANAFTLCDAYHCSVLGPTDPNRIMVMSGSIDPLGLEGGPQIDNNVFFPGQLRWQSFPEVLSQNHVDWFLFQESDNYGDNMLPYFAAYTDTSSDLHRRGCGVIPTKGLLGQNTAATIKQMVLEDTLPQVSYIVGPAETTEHPPNTPGFGARYIDWILDALTANPDVWAKTLFIINYDENDGHFDHVLPPTPPIGTEGEYLFDTQIGLGPNGPIGLGYRVPCLLISPFTRGPLVCSDIFDHTSVIKLLEQRFNVHCPLISDWRRGTVGDLTTAINFAGPLDLTVPKMPDAQLLADLTAAETTLPTPTVPLIQSMPSQGTAPYRGRPSGPVGSPR